MLFLSLLFSLAARADYTVSQFAAADIVSVSSSYAPDCETYVPSGGPDKAVTYVAVWMPIKVVTTSGELTLVDSGSGACYTNNGKPSDYGVCVTTRQAACDSLVSGSKEAVNGVMGSVFDVKSGRTLVGDHYCYVSQLRVTHDGVKVSDYSFEKQVVACP